MTYQEWVDDIGYKKAMKLLGHPESTLRMWYSFDRFPRPELMVNILEKSADYGVINVAAWTRKYTEMKMNKTNQAGEPIQC